MKNRYILIFSWMWVGLNFSKANVKFTPDYLLPKSKSKWSITYCMEFHKAFRILTAPSGYESVLGQRSSLYEYERPTIHVGILMGYNLSDKINLQAGLKYSDRGESIDNRQIKDSRYPRRRENRLSVHYNYIDIPLLVNYKLHAGKNTTFYIGGGASFNFFINERITNTRLGYFEREEAVQRRIGGSVIGKCGLQYDFNKNNFNKSLYLQPKRKWALLRTKEIGIFLEGGGNYCPFSLTKKDIPIKSYLYSYGVNAGIIYHL